MGKTLETQANGTTQQSSRKARTRSTNTLTIDGSPLRSSCDPLRLDSYQLTTGKISSGENRTYSTIKDFLRRAWDYIKTLDW